MLILQHQQTDTATLGADLDQLAHEMNQLHELARLADTDDARQHFARLEHTVNWRLNQLSYVLAAQDSMTNRL